MKIEPITLLNTHNMVYADRITLIEHEKTVFSCTVPHLFFESHDKIQKGTPGPLLDRIDIYFEVLEVDYDSLINDRTGESSALIRE